MAIYGILKDSIFADGRIKKEKRHFQLIQMKNSSKENEILGEESIEKRLELVNEKFFKSVGYKRAYNVSPLRIYRVVCDVDIHPYMFSDSLSKIEDKYGIRIFRMNVIRDHVYRDNYSDDVEIPVSIVEFYFDWTNNDGKIYNIKKKELNDIKDLLSIPFLGQHIATSFEKDNYLLEHLTPIPDSINLKDLFVEDEKSEDKSNSSEHEDIDESHIIKNESINQIVSKVRESTKEIECLLNEISLFSEDLSIATSNLQESFDSIDKKALEMSLKFKNLLKEFDIAEEKTRRASLFSLKIAFGLITCTILSLFMTISIAFIWIQSEKEEQRLSYKIGQEELIKEISDLRQDVVEFKWRDSLNNDSAFLVKSKEVQEKPFYK